MINSLDEFKVHDQALELGEEVWKIALSWKYFEKDTIGKQLVRAVDSIAANLSEGLGRYHTKEILNFCYYARGSLWETKTWIIKATHRELISKNQSDEIMNKLDIIGKMINTFIKSLKT